MKTGLFREKKLWIILVLAVPVIFWFFSVIFPIIASGLNRSGYQSPKKDPLEISGHLVVRDRDSREGKFIRDIRFPLTRRSDLRFDHDQFELRLYGLIEVKESGMFLIGTESDDGSWIWIDGEKVLDNGGIHSRTEKENLIHLETGLHSLELKFENRQGEAYLNVFWNQANKERLPLPLLSNPWGRVTSGLYRSAHLFFKIARYWFFFWVPLLLYRVLFPDKAVNRRPSECRE